MMAGANKTRILPALGKRLSCLLVSHVFPTPAGRVRVQYIHTGSLLRAHNAFFRYVDLHSRHHSFSEYDFYTTIICIVFFLPIWIPRAPRCIHVTGVLDLAARLSEGVIDS